ncbi:MAG: PHP domain-containing protein [Acutalibacteraceae bacterium]
MAVDLHCHTKLSDGSVGIEDLIAMAKRRHLSAVAVTDHDTMAAAVRAVTIGRRMGVNVIHGVEFSAWDTARGAKAHILCYLCDTPDRLEALCRKVTDSRKKAAVEMVRRVMRYYPITPELITKCASGSTVIYKQHIMHALMEAGYAGSIYGEVYEKLFGKEGAIQVKVDYPDVREALELIRSAGGIAVLAHPPLYGNEALMEELTADGLLQGIEAYHPCCDEGDTARLLAFAATHELLVTGGTDFHGMYTDTPRPLGSLPVPDDLAEKLKAFKART